MPLSGRSSTILSCRNLKAFDIGISLSTIVLLVFICIVAKMWCVLLIGFSGLHDLPTHDAGDLSRPCRLVEISDQGASGDVIEANYAILLRDDEHVLLWQQLGPDYHLCLFRSIRVEGHLLDFHEVLVAPHIDQREHFLESVALIV